MENSKTEVEMHDFDLLQKLEQIAYSRKPSQEILNAIDNQVSKEIDGRMEWVEHLTPALWQRHNSAELFSRLIDVLASVAYINQARDCDEDSDIVDWLNLQGEKALRVEFPLSGGFSNRIKANENLYLFYCRPLSAVLSSPTNWSAKFYTTKDEIIGLLRRTIKNQLHKSGSENISDEIYIQNLTAEFCQADTEEKRERLLNREADRILDLEEDIPRKDNPHLSPSFFKETFDDFIDALEAERRASLSGTGQLDEIAKVFYGIEKILNKDKTYRLSIFPEENNNIREPENLTLLEIASLGDRFGSQKGTVIKFNLPNKRCNDSLYVSNGESIVDLYARCDPFISKHTGKLMESPRLRTEGRAILNSALEEIEATRKNLVTIDASKALIAIQKNKSGYGNIPGAQGLSEARGKIEAHELQEFISIKTINTPTSKVDDPKYILDISFRSTLVFISEAP